MVARSLPRAPCLPSLTQVLGMLCQILEVVGLGDLGDMLFALSLIDLDPELCHLVT